MLSALHFGTHGKGTYQDTSTAELQDTTHKNAVFSTQKIAYSNIACEPQVQQAAGPFQLR